jgi:hypothetical protein
MRQALLHAEGDNVTDPHKMTAFETQKLIEKYPVVISKHFMQRVYKIVAFLKSNTSVLKGKMKDFF